jgi:hypothetical protein
MVLQVILSGFALSSPIFISFVRKIHCIADDWRGDHWFNSAKVSQERFPVEG